MDAKAKEVLIWEVLEMFPVAMAQPGNVESPRSIVALHDFDDESLFATRRSGFNEYKKGIFPAHVACTHHPSPGKSLGSVPAGSLESTLRLQTEREIIRTHAVTVPNTHPGFVDLSNLQYHRSTN